MAKLTSKQIAFLHAQGILKEGQTHMEHLTSQQHMVAKNAYVRENPYGKSDWHHNQAVEHMRQYNAAEGIVGVAERSHSEPSHSVKGETHQASHSGNVELKNHEHFEGGTTPSSSQEQHVVGDEAGKHVVVSGQSGSYSARLYVGGDTATLQKWKGKSLKGVHSWARRMLGN